MTNFIEINKKDTKIQDEILQTVEKYIVMNHFQRDLKKFKTP